VRVSPLGKFECGFKTIRAASQVLRYGDFFGFDFAGGGLGCFEVDVRMRGHHSGRLRPGVRKGRRE
jgi:hypothetical protein